MIEIIGLAAGFAVLSTAAYRWRGVPALLVLSALWLAGWVLVTLGALEPTHPVHAFERSPIPTLGSVVGATLVSAYVTYRQRAEDLLTAWGWSAIAYGATMYVLGIALFLAVVMICCP